MATDERYGQFSRVLTPFSPHKQYVPGDRLHDLLLVIEIGHRQFHHRPYARQYKPHSLQWIFESILNLVYSMWVDVIAVSSNNMMSV